MQNRIVRRIANKPQIATCHIRTGPPDVWIICCGNGEARLSIRGRIRAGFEAMAISRGITLDDAFRYGMLHIEKFITGGVA